MAVIEIAKIQVRRGQELQTGIPQLDPGEFGWAEDTENLYIGKRVVEGAINDENTRLLTEKDLSNFFAIVGSINTTTTLNSLYEYRDGVLPNTTITNLQLKLDSLNPSLNDFGLTTSTVEIQEILANAIDDLFNSGNASDKRILTIPAGSYTVNDTINLPPYTVLEGAGAGLTKITFISPGGGASLFKTVDGDGNDYETGMVSTTSSSRNIVIKGMTLEYSSGTTGTALISLDNVTTALIEDCTFRTEVTGAEESNPDYEYPAATAGIGVRIRGQGGPGVEKCKNISIERCRFEGILTGVEGTGTVVQPNISHSIFKDLNQGVKFYSSDVLNGPVDGFISYNTFRNIAQQAIYVGAYANDRRGNILSTQNAFVRVGNNYAVDSAVTGPTSCTSVISFLSAGNKSVDDVFSRRDYANTTTSGSFYYNPLIEGTTTILDNGVYSTSVSALSSKPVVKIPINLGNQSVTVNYQMYNGSTLSRKGKILLNIDQSGNTSYSDYYNFNEDLTEEFSGIVADSSSTVNTLLVTTTVGSGFDTLLSTLTPEDGTWYVTGTSYTDQAAIIVSVSSVSVGGNITYTILTDSDSPAFDFSTAGTYSILRSQVGRINFYTTLVSGQNFISLGVNNASDASTNFDHSIEIQT